ncbi:unnamed protein product [Blepharisma stoltei]|uniref:Uncharacterized protein n=1 Tax=Blepharisma stoltei TaxID=1481888 RepID=A0AAU9J1M4_9CILI|nr:unnamed protein product [Blepharisma stoltei]
MENPYSTKSLKRNRKKSPSTILSISSNSDSSDLQPSSNHILPLPSSNATTLSERSELAKIAKELKEDSKTHSPISLSDSDSDISISFLSTHLQNIKETHSSPLKIQTEDLSRKIKTSLQDLRKEANLYMDSSHRVLKELSSANKRMKESVLSCQSDGKSNSPASNQYLRSSFAFNCSPESFIQEQVRNLQKDIQLMQIRLTESEIALHNKGQENSQLKEVLKMIELKLNGNKELIVETEEKRIGCSKKCEIM